jgi:YD repeat-containing protein
MPAASQSGGAIRYYYDDAGRLSKVVDQNGNVATYSYDAVGNLLGITRVSIGSLAILNFVPQSGPVNQAVTIQGQGFSTTASANSVSFNGVLTPVSSATSTTLSVTVPPGATSGPISVTVGGQTVTSDSNFSVTNPTLASILVTPAGSSLSAPGQVQFFAVGVFSNGTRQDLTATVTWGSSNPSAAIVSNNTGSQGLVTGVASGVSNIIATSGSVSGSTPLRVNQVAGISIAPQTATTPVGGTQQFVANAIYSDGSSKNITTSVTWSSLNSPVATVSNANGSQGLASAVSIGSSSICAQFGANFDNCAILNVSAYLVSLAISPANETIPKGIQQQFTATGTYSDGSTRDATTAVNWSSSNVSVLTISNASGSQGKATDLGQGTATITAAAGSVSASTNITLTAPAPASIAVTPTPVALQQGNTAQLTAKLAFTDGTTQDVTQSATWSSSAASVATVGNAAGSQGLVTGVGPGTASITAAADSISGSAVVIVSGPNVVLFPRFLYTANEDGSISTYGIANGTGQLRFNGYSPGSGANAFTFDPAQKFLFAAGTGVSAYLYNSSDGSLTAVTGSPFALTGTFPRSIVTDPSGKFLYVGYLDSSLISAFSIDGTTGVLTPIPGSPYTTAGETYSLLVHPSGKYLFATNWSANVQGSVSVFSIDPTTGALTEIPGSPFPAGVDPDSLAQDPAGKFLLVSNSGQNFGSRLRPLKDRLNGVEVANDRGFDGLDISGISARQTTAKAGLSFGLSPVRNQGSLLADLTVDALFPWAGTPARWSLHRISPGFLQSSGVTGPCISVFAVDATSGALTEVSGSPFKSSHLNNFSGTLLANPTAPFVYVSTSGSFVGFNLDSTTGTLTELSDSPYSAPYTYYATWDPTGQFLFAAGQSALTSMSFIQTFSLNASTGTLTSVGAAPARILGLALAVGAGSSGITYSPRFAFATSGAAGANGMSAYTIDPIAGSLTAVSGSPFADGLSPVFTAAGTSGKFLYVVNHCSEPTCTVATGSVSAYAIDPNTGALTAIAGSPFPAGASPGGIAFDPSGLFAYVINDQDATVSIYTVDPSSGALAQISGSPFAANSTGSVAAAIDPMGLRFFVAAQCTTCVNGSLYIYGLGAPNIGPWAGLYQTLVLGRSPTSMAIDPVGSFAFVTDGSSNSIYVFSGIYGFATSVAGSPFAAGQNPVSVAVDPTGSFVYVANQASNSISAYTIDPVAGTLTSLASSPFTTGTGPVSVTVDYSGKFVYVVNGGDNTVSAFSIDPTSGALTPVAGSPFPAAGAPGSITTTGKVQ